ncbi:MAG TPA: LacI family DNA-binding transcriptional regulator [Chloroflexia bacterium]|nr:LacI family DNA-binding transcriptional regulator [Chloroflexia bacterium]
MAATAKDVAILAEVSVGTVSRVFNKHDNVNEELKQRVLKAAAEIGYFGPSSSSTRTGSSSERKLKEIGFWLTLDSDEDTSIDPFWAKILHGADSEAHKYDINVTYRGIRNISQNPFILSARLREMQPGGVMLVGPSEPDLINFIQSTNTPLVLVDNFAPRQAVDAVLCDNFEGARLAVEYLITLGHARIAFIGGPLAEGSGRPVNKIYPIERRAAGYRTALLDAGYNMDYTLYEACNLTPEGGYEACKRLLAGKAPFSAIFCANDKTAIGAMKALREADLQVPGDVSVIGFDDIEMAEHLTPALTTVRINKEAMGAVAVDRLISRASNPEQVNVTVTLGVDLIKRQSVAPYRS